MDYLVDILRDFGFPVCVCAVLFVFLAKQNSSHRDEVSELSAAVNSLRVVLQHVLDKIGGDCDA